MNSISFFFCSIFQQLKDDVHKNLHGCNVAYNNCSIHTKVSRKSIGFNVRSSSKSNLNCVACQESFALLIIQIRFNLHLKLTKLLRNFIGLFCSFGWQYQFWIDSIDWTIFSYKFHQVNVFEHKIHRSEYSVWKNHHVYETFSSDTAEKLNGIGIVIWPRTHPQCGKVKITNVIQSIGACFAGCYLPILGFKIKIESM